MLDRLPMMALAVAPANAVRAAIVTSLGLCGDGKWVESTPTNAPLLETIGVD